MRPRLFHLATVVSTALLLATAALWARSHRVADTFEWSGSKRELREVALLPGEVRIAIAPWLGSPFKHLTSYDHNRDVIFARRWSPSQTVLGIGFDAFTEEIGIGGLGGARPSDLRYPSRPLRVRVLTLRFPLLALVFAALPLLTSTRRLTRRLRLAAAAAGGHCPTCGYDLRATPQGRRCPECGAAGMTDDQAAMTKPRAHAHARSRL